MLKFLSLITGGIYGYITSAAIGGLVSAGAIWYLVHNHYENEITQLKLDAANYQKADVTNALNQLQNFARNINIAEASYQSTLENINSQFNSLHMEFKNATHVPLPVDCKPDAVRLRYINSAIANTNKTASPAR